MMFDMIEGAVATRTATDPTSPLVVSVPHAGLGTAGFEQTLNPELDVRCDADLFVDRLYQIGDADGPEVYVAAQTSRFVCDMNLIHISEPTRLLSISYAVFCLKKK